MDQSLRAIIWLKQRLAQRCSINVGFFVLSFVPSFIYSLTHSFIHSFCPRSQGHFHNLDFRGDSHVANPCSAEGLWPPVLHSFPPWGPQVPGQEPTCPFTLCRS